MMLANPIRRYFDADNVGDGDSLIEAFQPDAVVLDEGQAHHGSQAIAAW